jgi:hypothetical protein
MSLEDELKMLETVENIVGSSTIAQFTETRARLQSLIRLPLSDNSIP